MTALDRFDPFERRITEAIDEIAAARPPAYLLDTLRQTARTSQRPRWTFPERWLPMDTALARPTVVRRVPLRSLVVLALLATMVAATLFYIGSQRRLPPPFGPAGNGQIVFSRDGDLYVRESLAGEPRLFLGGPGDQAGVVGSPDGQLIAYDQIEDGLRHVWVAGADGSNPRQVLARAFSGLSFAWAPDSSSVAMVTDAGGALELWIAPADGSGARLIALDQMRPREAAWDPQRPGVLLVRAEQRLSGEVDLYYVDVASGAILSKLEMNGPMPLGPEYAFGAITFSPDGNTIAYNAMDAEEPPVTKFRVHVMNRDGTGDKEVLAPLETGYSQAWPIFSPDGLWIAMESWVTNPDWSTVNRLAVAPTDGSAAARFVGPDLPGQPLTKVWSPDGTRILLCSSLRNEVYAIDPAGGTFEQLSGASDLPDWQRIAVP